MNFHDKREIPPKYIYLFLTVVCFILLFLSLAFGQRFSPLKTIASAVIVPMQSGINEVGSGIYNNVTNQKEKAELLEENKALQDTIDEYYAQLKLYEQESYELKRLQALLDLQEQYGDYTTVGAHVIATDSTNWFYTFVIDKGTNDGVQVGCNILADGGLAGIVTEVGQTYAKVRAIIDDNSNVSATVSGTQTLCTVSGDLSNIKDGYISVGYINKEDAIEDGAELVTSYVSDKFLPGLLIGYVTDVTLDANNLTKSAKCLPVVDFSNLQEVLVILELKSDIKTQSTNSNIYDAIMDSDTTEAGDGQKNSSTTEEATTEEVTTSEAEDTSATAQDTSTSGTVEDDNEDSDDNGD